MKDREERATRNEEEQNLQNETGNTLTDNTMRIWVTSREQHKELAIRLQDKHWKQIK